MRKFNIVIAPSGYARLSNLQIRKNKLTQRPLKFFALQKIWVTLHAVILGQQRVTRVSIAPRVKPVGDEVRKCPWVTGKRTRSMVTICYILVSSVSMVTQVKAECTPTPNCAEIGYTATSCSGVSLKCPFDTSKLFCIPCDSTFKYDCNETGQVGKGDACNGKYQECACDSAYKYTCSGTGYSGGSGTACDGKYASCTCRSGYAWNGSACTASCTSSSYNYCRVHGTCHGDCCSNGRYESCDPICGGSGCSEPDCGCPASICSAVGGTYSGGCCSESCINHSCDESCCNSVGGTMTDGYCTAFCNGLCYDISIGGGGD